MKKLFFLLLFCLFIFSGIKAQNNDIFKKHEIGWHLGAFNIPYESTDNINTSYIGITYSYRHIKWLWIGINVVCAVPSNTWYWREYYSDGSFQDFNKTSFTNKEIVIAPELRLSFLNKKYATLYSGFSLGYNWQMLYKGKDEFNKNIFSHFTMFGLSQYIGKNRTFYVGAELGVGYKGILSIHSGYRF